MMCVYLRVYIFFFLCVSVIFLFSKFVYTCILISPCILLKRCYCILPLFLKTLLNYCTTKLFYSVKKKSKFFLCVFVCVFFFLFSLFRFSIPTHFFSRNSMYHCCRATLFHSGNLYFDQICVLSSFQGLFWKKAFLKMKTKTKTQQDKSKKRKEGLEGEKNRREKNKNLSLYVSDNLKLFIYFLIILPVSSAVFAYKATFHSDLLLLPLDTCVFTKVLVK